MFSSNTTQVSGGYEIQRSLRFNSADSADLTRTPASAGNRRIWTWSGWVKRSALIASGGASQNLFGARDGSYTLIRFVDGNNFRYQDTNGDLVTTATYRDVSAWYHIVVAVDTTQATASNRVKIYFNNVQVSQFTTTTYPDQNYETNVNRTIDHRIGSQPGFGEYFNGYMTEVNFIDGQALTPSSFGEFNADTGVWQPKRYAGSYGTNGFYLNFSNNSNTTAATLGADYSGNGNNWTPNNFSVSAGAGNDSLVDVPTNWGVDTGVGGSVRGNYCTLNPLDKFPTATVTANGNLDTILNTGTNPDLANTVGTIAVSSGKWYWEFVWTANSGSIVGVWDTASSGLERNRGASFFYGYIFTGSKLNTTVTSYGASYTYNDVIGIALDMDAGTITFYKNGVSQGVAFSSLAGKTITPILAADTGSVGASINGTFNFGQRPFAYTAPSGFRALNTQNLPTPTIGATPATQANKYFDVVLRNGGGTSGGTYSTTINMANGALLWDKTRSSSADHFLVDSVRGISKTLSSNTTGAEATYTTWFTGFNNGSFTTGSADWPSGTSIVDWIWAANGAGVTNTAGSITSTVSANTTSGFSVVTYTGTGSLATVGHGLGAAPRMVVTKTRTGSSSGSWQVFHTAIGPTQAIFMNLSNGAFTSNQYWNNTAPTSSVFSLGTNSDGNGNGSTYVAYCFAEVPGYSRFGSYTGNGSSDGPFVFCGFRPAFLMIKRTDTAGFPWVILDSKRNTFNPENLELYPNTSAAEANGGTTYIEDFLSNGFKIRQTDGTWNASGGTYIFAAFAEVPQKFSLAR